MDPYSTGTSFVLALETDIYGYNFHTYMHFTDGTTLLNVDYQI